MTAASHSTSAELAVLLSQLSEQVQHTGDGSAQVENVPTPSEAMALYFVSTRLVELQLQLLERDRDGSADGTPDPSAPDHSADIARTREVLEGTRAVLRASLAKSEEADDSGEPGSVFPLVRKGRPRRRTRHPHGE